MHVCDECETVHGSASAAFRCAQQDRDEAAEWARIRSNKRTRPRTAYPVDE